MAEHDHSLLAFGKDSADGGLHAEHIECARGNAKSSNLLGCIEARERRERSHAFAKVLLDPAGVRHVPHHRAVDMASDNRLPPLVSVSTTHSFAWLSNCPTATVSRASSEAVWK